MSQSGRLVTNQPVPGAGIQTVTGNAGGPVPGDGGANIGLIGAGTITVTGNPGANTLTISSIGVPAGYTADDGLQAIPDGAGNLNIFQADTNINTSVPGPNTIGIALANDIIIGNTITADGNIVSNFGNITATNGDVTAGGNVHANGAIQGVGGGLFNNTVTITAGGIDVTGPARFGGLARGVVQTDAAHNLFADNGADGQILIGGGVAPVWANILGDARITVTNTPNGIQLHAAPALPSGFHTDAGNAVPVANILNILGGTNINTAGAGNTVTVNLDTNILVNSVETNALHAHLNSDLDGALNVGGLSQLHNTTVLGGSVLTLQGQANGVLQTGAIGQVVATNGNPAGTNGQVLISGGVRPVWNNITSAAATIVITNPAPNTINLETAGGGGAVGAGITSFFGIPMAVGPVVTVGSGRFYLGSILAEGFDMGQPDCFNIGNNFYPGGLGPIVSPPLFVAPARYTAPLDGSYFFDMQLQFNGAISPAAYPNMIMGIHNMTTGRIWYTRDTLWFTSDNARIHDIMSYCTYIYLANGNIVQFFIQFKGGTPVSGVGYTGVNCFVSGHKVA